MLPDVNRPSALARYAAFLALALAFSVGCGSSASPSPAPSSLAAMPRAERPRLQPIAPPRLIELTRFEQQQMSPIGPSLGPQLERAPEGPGDTDGSIGAEFTLLDEPPASPKSAQTATDIPNSDSTAPGDPATGDAQIHEAHVAAEPWPAHGTRLPWGPSTPSTELVAVAARAEETARRGFEIAQRGGLYSARVKFTESLRIVAEALDAQRNTRAHSDALAAGLRALEEVDDFVPRGGQFDNAINLPLIVDAHRTPVLKGKPLDGVTPLIAQRLYLTYAQEQLSAAGGDQPVASLALHGLGKICTAPAQLHGPREQIAEAKAIVYFQSAVLIEPRNFMAANELGVLLTRFGRLHEARASLEQAAMASSSPATWRNLAVVNQRLGEQEKAAICRAKAEHLRLAAAQPTPGASSSQHPVRWVDVETFAQSNTSTPAMPSVSDAQSARAQPPVEPTGAAAKSVNKTSSRKWPWQ